ncbi:uncharacterized protein PAC_10820 [Phialocephala subalpina]|uniref:Zn(2)-C6 fungal-type domain-containing protein n=1 Tax=Phialocephala subalpina TaxID=576137 RepID=A0A1L7X7C8_9HELO|nr:uncharacterized protein PAC_10820 [Phialocephala subalpina]
MRQQIQRYSCDRCHGQKVRCTRAETGGMCVRCEKAKAKCTWSPSQRKQRKDINTASTLFREPFDVSQDPSHPDIGLQKNGQTNHVALASSRQENNQCSRQIQTSTLDSVLFNSPNEQLGQPVLDFDFQMGMNFLEPTTAWTDSPSDPSSSAGAGNTIYGQGSPQRSSSGLDTWQHRFNHEWAMLSSDDIHTEQLSTSRDQPKGASSSLAITTIQALSDLNVELYAHAAMVPKPPKSSSQPLTWKDKDLVVDKTFQLSQRFIDVLNKFYPRYVEASTSSSSPNTSASSASSPRTGMALGRLHAAIDQGSFLLILSCHLRLIDTYENIFGNMQACLDRSSVTECEDHVGLPNVKVGSFSIPDTSAVQITLILHLARHLLSRMGELIKSIESSQTSDRVNEDGSLSVGSDSLVSPTLEAVHSREKVLVERISRLRKTFIDLNIL